MASPSKLIPENPLSAKFAFQRHTSHRWFLARELSIIACDMHGKTFSRNDLQHTKDPTDRFFVGFDKAIIRFSRFPLLLACQAPPKIAMHDASLKKTLSLAACSQPKPSLGAPKNEASSALERQKCLRCCAEENRRCRGVSKHLPPKSHFFFRSDGCYVESNREVVAYMSSAAIGLQNARNHLGFTVQEQVKEKWLAFNCSSILVWICGTEEVLDSPFWRSLNLRHWLSLVERRTGIHT